MRKIVINRCWGGFGLSIEAMEYARKKGYKWALEYPIHIGEKFKDGSILDSESNNFNPYVKRDSEELIEVVETLGSEKASGDFTELKIVEIPDDVDWEISEYDGLETVEERHRTWR